MERYRTKTNDEEKEAVFITVMLLFIFLLLSPATVLAAPDMVIDSGTLYSEDVNIPVELLNNNSVAHLQFDVTYDPSQLVSGTPIGNSALADHVVASSEPSAGVRRVVIYSMSKALIGNGPLISIPFSIVHGAAVGEKNLILSNAVMSNAGGGAVVPTSLVPGSIIVADTDHDTIPDSWEISIFGDLATADQTTDYDHDVLLDKEEFNRNTDPKDSDTDNDGMSDGWEVRNRLDPLIGDASLDPDGDGYSNLEEFNAGSNPQDPESFPVNLPLDFVPGFNLVSIPMDTSSIGTAFQLIPLLGDGQEIDRVIHFDRVSGIYEEAYYQSNNILIGANFVYKNGDALIVYSKVGKLLIFTSKVCPVWDLVSGLNLVGSPCAPPTLTSFQLLQLIGDETVVNSIQRYRTTDGQFETAAYENGQPVGVDFSIAPGEGYFVFMKQDKPGFRP